MTHPCNATGCDKPVPSNVFMCARHWRMVPRQLANDLRDAWRDRSDACRSFTAEAIKVVSDTEGGRSAPGVEPGMKALTIWQPWATLVMIGAKPYEFRRWNFTDKPNLAKLVGRRVVIHAGARAMKRAEIEDIVARLDDGESALDPKIARPLLDRILATFPRTFEAAPIAGALGTVTLGDPKRAFDLFVDKVADSDRLDQHMYAWPMIEPTPFPAFVPAAGAQGFWNWS